MVNTRSHTSKCVIKSSLSIGISRGSTFISIRAKNSNNLNQTSTLNLHPYRIQNEFSATIDFIIQLQSLQILLTTNTLNIYLPS